MKKVYPEFILDLDVYNFDFCFNHIMAAICIGNSSSTSKLDNCEDVCIVVEAIVSYWNCGCGVDEDEVCAQNEWLRLQPNEENDIQAYAARVAEKFIDAYLEVLHEKE